MKFAAIAHRPALCWGSRELSWGQLESYIHSTTRRLKEFGVRKGCHVLVEAAPVHETVILFLSLWRAGAVVCPLDPLTPGAIVSRILQTIVPACYFYRASPLPNGLLRRSFSFNDTICVEPVEQFFSGGGGWENNPFSFGPDDSATIILTSGSSGRPKAVLHSFRAHQANAEGAATLIPFGSGDSWLMTLPLHHVSGMAVIFRALHKGGCLVFYRREDGKPLDLAAAIAHHRPTHVSLVPAQLKRWLEHAADREVPGSLKAVLVGGAPIPRELLERASGAGIPVFITYGLTETASQVATAPWRRDDEEGAVVLPGREVCLRQGEVLVKGDVLMKGYLCGENLERPFDADGWFATGDMGALTQDGHLTVLGRKDRMFISGGENIYPEVIEKVLLEHDNIVAARVTPEEDADLGAMVTAVIRVNNKADMDLEHLKIFLKARLMAYQVPKRIRIDKALAFPKKQGD